MQGLDLTNYEIIRPIWSGASKTIYEGIDKRTGFRSAISIYKNYSLLETLKKRIVDGSTLPILNLKHKNINTELDLILGQEVFAITNDFLEGKNLSDLLESTDNLDFKEIKQIIMQILDGFEYAHKNGFIHGELNPSKIFIQNDGIIKILGFEKRILFGIHNDNFKGARIFISPEEFLQGQNSIDQISDIYHIGLILYNLITGIRPNFHCGFRNPDNYIFGPFPEFNFQNSWKNIEFIIKKSCALKKDDRYKSVSDLRISIEDYFTNNSV